MTRATIATVALGLACAGVGVYYGVKTMNLQPGAAQASANPVATLLAQRLATPDGTMHNLAQWKGRTLVVNYWATWCAPCVEEMPALSAMQQSLPQTVQILGIGIDTLANISTFTTRYHIAYPTYVAGTGGLESMRQFGNELGGLPYSVLIDGTGTVVHTYIGKLDLDGLRRDILALPAKS